MDTKSAKAIYRQLYEIADDGGVIQAVDMLASDLTGGRPDLDSTQTIRSAFRALVPGIEIEEVE